MDKKEEETEQSPIEDEKRGRSRIIDRRNIKKKKEPVKGRQRCLSASDNNRTFTSQFINKWQNDTDCEFLPTKKLPEDFANEVLDKEIQIENNDFTLETVNRLIFLYSQAIEFYEGVDPGRYQNYYKRIQNLVAKPVVHEVMKNITTKKKVKEDNSDKENQHDSFSMTHNNTQEKQKMQMDILLMQEESKDKNKFILAKYDQGEMEKSKLLENDIRSQSFSLEKRLAHRRFSQNKRVLTRSHSSYLKENDEQCVIGSKDESSKDEYSSIIQNGNSKLEDSWSMENKFLLSNLTQDTSSYTTPNYTYEEVIVEVVEEDH